MHLLFILLHPFLLGSINHWMGDGVRKPFGDSAPFDTTYIELYHELVFMFCYVCLPFSLILWYEDIVSLWC